MLSWEQILDQLTTTLNQEIAERQRKLHILETINKHRSKKGKDKKAKGLDLPVRARPRKKRKSVQPALLAALKRRNGGPVGVSPLVADVAKALGERSGERLVARVRTGLWNLERDAKVVKVPKGEGQNSVRWRLS